ncbi:PREDICTED: uncharacterized protein LOC104704888 [Camelina sativa]|uniref:Uncharacterized protein LOC104704888 n=1 Tax=Camelina sativa TaxID=90675 RepID=A0ABM0T109_CAMSA|nr:PREDICTED: uncharacterized protein LOC104704888 [Camelina sativa]
MAVKTDMSKAYDRIEWSFIRHVLERMGFHPTWTNWIMQCVFSVSYSFLLNNSVQGSVLPQRGIRQGDPLSPYLFILCTEVLSGICTKAQAAGRLTGIRVAKGCPRITHLLFAEDTMFFCRANETSCVELTKILEKYGQASRQMINKQKSAITFSRKTPRPLKDATKHLLNIQKEGGLGKYLGLPELFGKKKEDLFNGIIDRIRQRALSCSSRFLSAAGKTTLLTSVLAAMPTYTMSCFKIPVSLCKRIKSALTRFWWDANDGKKKMVWVSWDKLTLSKRDGGLGFRDIQRFNDALLAKVSWRILTNPTCLLARTLLGKYCKHSSFLTCNVPNAASHGWRGICAGRDLIQGNTGKVIGDGKDTSVWYDHWLSFSEQKAPMGPPNKEDQSLRVADLWIPATQSWNLEKISEIIPEYQNEIIAIRPSTMGARDKLIWLSSTSGEYSSKSGYFEATKDTAAMIKQTCHIEEFSWTSNVWNIKSSPKLKFHLWKMLREALPVGQNLRTRGIESAACIHCNQEESTLHLFFQCPFATQVWSLTPFKNPFIPSRISSLFHGIETLQRQISLPPVGLGETPLAPWILWHLWTSRNKKLFEDRQISAAETLTTAIVQAKEWSAAQLVKPSTTRVNPSVPRPLADPDLTTIFTDVAWRSDTQDAGFGWAISYPGSQTDLRRQSSARHVRSALMAEAMAIHQAILHAKDIGITKFSLASDSLQVIKAINSAAPQTELHGILHDILLLSSDFEDAQFRFVSRKDNCVAHDLAKSSLFSFSSVPGLTG